MLQFCNSGIAAQDMRVIHIAGGIVHRIIPGNIHVIPFPADLHDIPGVVSTLTGADNDTAVNSQLQQQPVQQHSVALTDRGPVDQRRICGILELIVRIAKVDIIM